MAFEWVYLQFNRNIIIVGIAVPSLLFSSDNPYRMDAAQSTTKCKCKDVNIHR